MMLILLALALLGADTDVRLKADTTAVDVRLKADTTATAVASAIERAVIDRMGDVQVVIREVSTAAVDRRGLVAAIEPGARLGQPIRFILSADGKRVGSAVARLDVVGSAARARRSLARDEEITAADVDATRVELKNVLVRRMPELDDVVGTRARRDIVSGEVLTTALVTAPPAVRAGDEVRVNVRMG